MVPTVSVYPIRLHRWKERHRKSAGSVGTRKNCGSLGLGTIGHNSFQKRVERIEE